jgi:hypothetical protein
MYQSPYTFYSANFQNTSLIKFLKLIQEYLSVEKDDQIFCDYLISAALNKNEKILLPLYIDNEIKHNKLFKKIYKDITRKK